MVPASPRTRNSASNCPLARARCRKPQKEAAFVIWGNLVTSGQKRPLVVVTLDADLGSGLRGYRHTVRAHARVGVDTGALRGGAVPERGLNVTASHQVPTLVLLALI